MPFHRPSASTRQVAAVPASEGCGPSARQLRREGLKTERFSTPSDYALVVQAAVKGQAVALGWWHVVAHELNQRGLVRAASRQLETGDNYYISAPEDRPLQKPAALVRDWLIDEMAGMERI